MTVSPLRLYSIGSYMLLIVAIAHLAGHFLPIPLENSTEIQLDTLMKTYPKKIAGGRMTMMDIHDGLSLCYMVFFAFAGLINLILLRKEPVEWTLLKQVSLLNVITFTAVMIISAVYFFWIPVVSCLLVAATFLFARLNF